MIGKIILLVDGFVLGWFLHNIYSHWQVYRAGHSIERTGKYPQQLERPNSIEAKLRMQAVTSRYCLVCLALNGTGLPRRIFLNKLIYLCKIESVNLYL